MHQTIRHEEGQPENPEAMEVDDDVWGGVEYPTPEPESRQSEARKQLIRPNIRV
jgi:hypothetical protein